ncbi:MAG: PD40 domain-containing protein [Alphaproteobacteria bacterium]|nr:PD40 domain-containing protein [Alphaproteobacteria bacterium]
MLGRSLARLLLLTASLGVAPALAAEVSTKDSGHAQNPQWSPDGQWLAFEINNMSNTVELFLVQVNGGQPGDPAQLKIPGASSSFGGGSVASTPVWASNPNLMVIFEGTNAGGVMRLYYAAPGAGAPNELITASQMQGNLAAPAMAPDGSRFAFVADATGMGDIYVWDIASGEINNIFPSNVTESNPSFSPDGKKLVFSRKNKGNEDLFTWTGSSTTPPLLGGAGDQTRPRWAGDQVVYFTGERGEGHWDIAVSSGPGERTVIARDVRLPARSAPALAPDSGAVAYTMADPDKGGSVFVTRLDGSGTKEIPTGLVACGEPSLVSVNGRTLLAFTALPAEGSDWRRLHIIDVTGKI